MWLDTDPAITPTTASGAKSKSSCGRRRASLPSLSTLKPVTLRRDTKRRNFLNVLSAAALLVCFGLSLGTIAPTARAQNLPPNIPPPPTPGQQGTALKSTTDLVVLHATVVDEKGQFVTGLERD